MDSVGAHDWSTLFNVDQVVIGTARISWADSSLMGLFGPQRFSVSCAWDFSAMQRTKRLRRKLGRLIRRGLVQKVKYTPPAKKRNTE